MAGRRGAPSARAAPIGRAGPPLHAQLTASTKQRGDAYHGGGGVPELALGRERGVRRQQSEAAARVCGSGRERRSRRAGVEIGQSGGSAAYEMRLGRPCDWETPCAANTPLGDYLSSYDVELSPNAAHQASCGSLASWCITATSATPSIQGLANESSSSMTPA